jgi:peptidoglycan/LPS O-acetylase OafA/YrhL
MTTAKSQRLYFVDYLRVLLILLVIAHHAGQAYGPTGGNWPITNPESSRLLKPFFDVNPMFFMGLFFLVAGYFVPFSFARKGAGAFSKGRLLRLGIPTLFFALFVHGPIAYLSLPRQPSFVEFVRYLYKTGWQQLYIHLWFLAHLLVYSLVYVAWRLVADWIRRPDPSSPPGLEVGLPKRVVIQHGAILLYVIALALVAYVVRIKYPIDRWVPFLIFPIEPAHLPQYVSMFVIGILAYRGDWLRRLPTATGIIWLAIGLAAVAGYYLYSLVLAQSLPEIVAIGGKSWQSLVFCTWEAFVCAGLGVGLLVLFRERLNGAPGKLLAAIVGATYGAYIIHLLVVLGVQAGMDGVALPPFIKFIIVWIIAAIFSFGVAFLAKKLPGLRRIL